MSIFVSQPHKRVRRLSGLGALAAIWPTVQREGTGAFLDNDVCDYEALVQRIAAELGVYGQYQGKPALAMQDAAIYAHEIYTTHCAAARDVYVTNQYESGGGAWGWWPGRSRRRRRHDGGHGHGHGSNGSGDARYAGPHDMVSVPQRTNIAPSVARTTYTAHSRAPGAAPMAPPAMHHRSSPGRMAPSRVGPGPTSHRMRGLGQLLDPSALRQGGTLPASVQHLAPATVQAMQQQVRDRIASTSAITFTDPSDSPAPAGTVSSFTIEGALPGGVALLLGGALGLLGASMLFGGGK